VDKKQSSAGIFFNSEFIPFYDQLLIVPFSPREKGEKGTFKYNPLKSLEII